MTLRGGGMLKVGEQRWGTRVCALSGMGPEAQRLPLSMVYLDLELAWLRLAGLGGEEQHSQNPTPFFFFFVLINLNPLHCLGTKLLTDMLNLLNNVFCKFWEKENALWKKNYRCWEVVMRLTWGTRSSSVLWIAISLLLKSLLAM